jgi:hypothetical protein
MIPLGIYYAAQTAVSIYTTAAIIATTVKVAQFAMDFANAKSNGLNTGESLLCAGVNAGLGFLTQNINIPGIIPNGSLHAGMNIVSNGISNSILGEPFFENWGPSAISGGISGGISGFTMSHNQGLNYWWGTDQSKWGYNRDQWSLAWWDKPDKIVFEEVKNRGAGQINCMARSFEDMYGNTEAYWDTYTNSGDNLHTMRNIRNGSGHVMQYPTNDPNYVNYDDILSLDQSGGRGMITFDNYRNSGQGHAVAVKKILYVPGKRFDAVIFDPYNGSRFKMRNFNQGSGLGQNLRFWFINL